jgi:hypothetical protein
MFFCVLPVNNARTRVSHCALSVDDPPLYGTYEYVQPKLKSVRSLSKLLTVETGHCICVFSTSNDRLVQDISLDKGAADFQMFNKLTHNLRHFVGSQPDRSLATQNGFRRTIFHAHTHPVTKILHAVRIKNYILHLKYELQ